MDSAKSRNLLLVAGGASVLIIVGAAYFLLTPTQESPQIPEIESGPDISAQVSGAVETPADKLPETNPFSEYKNPFE